MIESQPGWEVCCDAVNGREAIEKATQYKPDLVILDFAMPRLDGLKTAAEMRKLLPDLPILLFTMYGSGVKHEAAKQGITVVDKAQSETLIEIVEQLLNSVKETFPPPPTLLDITPLPDPQNTETSPDVTKAS